MRTFSKLGVLAVVALALSAVGTTNALAAPAQFTASATGSLTGKALETQTFGFTGGQIKCTTAETTGTISSTATTQQHLTVNYKSCTGFGGTVHISPATYLITANGEVHIKETITINATTGACHLTIGPQTIKTFGYATNGSKLKVTPSVTAIAYASTGGACGASGTNGTFTGASELERVGGGSMAFDKETIEPTPQFTASATGSLSGKATSTQTFTFNAGQLKCTTAATSGTITEVLLTKQHFTVSYSGCSLFGFANVHLSPATYLYTANGEVHLQSSFTINLTIGGCHITIPTQTMKSYGFATNGTKVKVTPNVTGFTYTTTGGLCGSSGANGTFTGTSEIERVGGGSFTYDP